MLEKHITDRNLLPQYFIMDGHLDRAIKGANCLMDLLPIDITKVHQYDRNLMNGRIGLKTKFQVGTITNELGRCPNRSPTRAGRPLAAQSHRFRGLLPAYQSPQADQTVISRLFIHTARSTFLSSAVDAACASLADVR